MAKSICALARMPCPKTADTNAKVFCPNWKDAIPEHEKDGSGRIIPLSVYTGCQLPRLIPYMQSIATEADHAHASANQARDSAIEAAQSGQLMARELRLQEDKLRAAILPALFTRIGLSESDETKELPDSV